MDDHPPSPFNGRKVRLHARLVILRYLLVHSGVNREDIRGLLQTTHQNVTYHLTLLEQAGFVTRNVDQKPHKWFLTARGEALFGYSSLQRRLYVIIPVLIGGILLLGSFLSPFLTQDPQTIAFLVIGFTSSAITALSLGIVIGLIQYTKSKR